ncbi:MAG: NAD-dependent epimerase/dehydratase family protein [Thermoplasmataceae archaeon]
MYIMKSALISGGNGFLGFHLVRKLLSQGFSITVVDDLSTSKKVLYDGEVEFCREKIEEFSASKKYDYVIHLASRPSPEDYSLNPIATMMSNSLGTVRMLDIALDSGATFLYTSSSEVYGNAAIIPTPESYYGYVNPNGVRSCYDEGKRFSEAISMAYFRQHKLDVRIQRPFNVYGPGIREDGLYGRVIPRFIVQALSGDDITVHGDGSQTRSFLYVDDWVEATWKLTTMGGLGGTVLNIGSDDEMTINDLAEITRTITASGSRIVHTGKRVDDPERRSADLTNARRILGWQPATPLKDGLKKTIEWFRVRNE